MNVNGGGPHDSVGFKTVLVRLSHTQRDQSSATLFAIDFIVFIRVQTITHLYVW